MKPIPIVNIHKVAQLRNWLSRICAHLSPGLVAGVYSGITYGLEESRGVHDWVRLTNTRFFKYFSFTNICSFSWFRFRRATRKLAVEMSKSEYSSFYVSPRKECAESRACQTCDVHVCERNGNNWRKTSVLKTPVILNNVLRISFLRQSF